MKSTPGLLDETQSPELTGYGGGFGAGYGSYSTNVPGGRSGYSGASRGYLNSEYNAKPRGGFGGGYSSGFASGGPMKAPTPTADAIRGTEYGLWLGLRTQPQRGNTAPGAGTSTLAGAPSAAPQKKAAAASYAAGTLWSTASLAAAKVLKATPIAGTALSRFSLTASASKDDGKLCAAEKWRNDMLVQLICPYK